MVSRPEKHSVLVGGIDPRDSNDNKAEVDSIVLNYVVEAGIKLIVFITMGGPTLFLPHHLLLLAPNTN